MLFPVSFFILFYFFFCLRARITDTGNWSLPNTSQASVTTSTRKEMELTYYSATMINSNIKWALEWNYDWFINAIAFQSAETNSVAAFYEKAKSGRPSAATRESDCTPSTATPWSVNSEHLAKDQREKKLRKTVKQGKMDLKTNYSHSDAFILL